MTVVLATSATVAVSGAAGSYVPGTDILTGVGAGGGTQPTFNVTHTRVRAATVDVAGTGGTDGAGKIVTGTTGAGTPFQASVTVASGGIASVQSITVPGDYTTNPTSLAHEPVTGDSLTGAQLSISMGALAVGLRTPGDLDLIDPDPTLTTNSGSATGATLHVVWDQFAPSIERLVPIARQQGTQVPHLLPTANWSDSRSLAGGVAEPITPPVDPVSGAVATLYRINATAGPLYINFAGAAVIPISDTTDGSSSIMIHAEKAAVLLAAPLATDTLSIICAASSIVTIEAWS